MILSRSALIGVQFMGLSAVVVGFIISATSPWNSLFPHSTFQLILGILWVLPVLTLLFAFQPSLGLLSAIAGILLRYHFVIIQSI